MKKIFLIILPITIISSCVNPPVEKIVYVPVTDTVTITDRQQIVALEYKCSMLQDSLNYIKDSIGEDLFVAKYKLGRIKYYTDIVDKNSSQLKFYKGWIKRVLKD